jgi:hypothetical protein
MSKPAQPDLLPDPAVVEPPVIIDIPTPAPPSKRDALSKYYTDRWKIFTKEKIDAWLNALGKMSDYEINVCFAVISGNTRDSALNSEYNKIVANYGLERVR